VRRPGDPERAERADLPAVQVEPAEDVLLAPGEVCTDPAQAGGHLERADLQVGPRLIPAAEQAIRLVIGHLSIVATTNLVVSIFLARYLI